MKSLSFLLHDPGYPYFAVGEICLILYGTKRNLTMKVMSQEILKTLHQAVLDDIAPLY